MRYLAILFLLTSCASWHCRKCLDKATVKSDTVFRDTIVYVPSVKIDTVIHYDLSTDTLVIEKDKLRIKFRDIPGPTVYLSGECLPDTLKIEVPVLVTNEVKTGYKLVHLIGVGLLIFLIMGAVLFIVKR